MSSMNSLYIIIYMCVCSDNINAFQNCTALNKCDLSVFCSVHV